MIKNIRPFAGKLLLLFTLIAVMLVAGGCAGIGAQQAGWAGVTVADGNIYFGSTNGSLIALDDENGAELWRKPFEASSSGGIGCSPSEVAVPLYGTPVVDGDLVYIAGYDGKIYAINTSAGAERWIYPRQGNLHSFVGGLLINQGVLYIGSIGGIVYALDSETGDWIWEFETGEQIWATPAINGDTLYIGTFNKKLYAIDAATGEEKWQQPFEAQGPIISNPLVEDGIIYISSFDRHIYAINAATGEKIWQYPSDDEAEGNPEKWFWASPVLYNNTIYAVNMDGKVYILDAGNNGNLIKIIDLDSPVSSTPVAANDKVFIASEEGKIFYIDTNDNSKMTLPSLGGKVIAPLFVSDGVVYIHTNEDEIIYKLSAETGVSLWNVPISSE